MATYPLEIWTLRSYVDHGYTVNLRCEKCGWRPSPNLPALVAAGHGDKAMRDLHPVCDEHRIPLGLTIVPPSKRVTGY